MKRVAIAAAAGALVATALLVVTMVRLWRAADAVATRVPCGGLEERRLVIGGASALVIEEGAAYRIDPSLHAAVLYWPTGLRVDKIESAAIAGDAIALTAEAHDANPDKHYAAVLLVENGRVSLLWKPSANVQFAHVSNVRADGPQDGEPKETRFAVYIQEDERIYRLPIVDAHRDADEDRTRIGSGYWADRTKRIVWRDGEGPLFVLIGREIQAADLYGWSHEVPPIGPPPSVLEIRDGALVEARAMRIGAARLELRDGQARLFDAAGARLDRVGKWISLRERMNDPSPAWLIFAALVIGGLGSLARSLARVVRGGVPGDVHFGTLHVPPGAALDTDARGHVGVSGGCSVRIRVGADGLRPAVPLAGGVEPSQGSTSSDEVELGPGLSRADERREVPLIDGDAVFVLGRITREDAGPFRSTGRSRLVSDGGRHAIGRGTAADFAEQLGARAHRALLRGALVTLIAALALLLRFAA
jgi:hypothetical protein